MNKIFENNYSYYLNTNNNYYFVDCYYYHYFHNLKIVKEKKNLKMNKKEKIK